MLSRSSIIRNKDCIKQLIYNGFVPTSHDKLLSRILLYYHIPDMNKLSIISIFGLPIPHDLKRVIIYYIIQYFEIIYSLLDY